MKVAIGILNTSCDRPFENCAVTVPSLPMLTPVTLPNSEPSSDVPFNADVLSNCVRPVVLLTVPRLMAMALAGQTGGSRPGNGEVEGAIGRYRTVHILQRTVGV